MFTRRSFLQTTTAALAAAATRRPNIIVIQTCDQGYADLSFQGCKDFSTPYIDRLSGAGVHFTNGYSSHPFCSPARAGLLTGRYQHRFGYEDNPLYDPHNDIAGLPVREITLANLLSDAGYATGQIGKWHLGAAPQFHPLKRGFKEQFGFLGGSHDYFKADADNPKAADNLLPIERDGKPVVETEYLTDAFSREASAFVRRHDKDPFFLYLCYSTPHAPLQAPPAYLERVKTIEDPIRRAYAAMMCAMDDGIGRLAATLEVLKLENDTLIFFLSDHGGPPETKADNHPFRGYHGQLYEGGIHVPFVMKWKGHVPEGETYASPVIALDIFATAAAAAGVRVPADRPLDGVNLLPYLNGKNTAAPHVKLFWRTGGGESFAVRQGNWKLVKNGKRTELYDLDTDVGESKNVAADKPEILSRLEASRLAWNRQMIAPIFQFSGPPPPKKQR